MRLAHAWFSRIVRSEIGVEEGETTFKRGKAPSEAVSDRATNTTVATILCADLAAGVLGEEGCPLRRMSLDDVIRNCTHDCAVTVMEGLEPVVNKKGVPATVCR